MRQNGMMPGCSRCGSTEVRRSIRRTVWETLLSAVGILPYRCERCSARFFRWNWFL